MRADGNEVEVGEGIAEAITLGIVTRAELWVTLTPALTPTPALALSAMLGLVTREELWVTRELARAVERFLANTDPHH
eukprot:scaffold58623_cov51-Phaeocystis_antarctica.AAC.2